METQLTKIALILSLGIALCFAQEAPERLAVYAYGAEGVGINKSLGNKLLEAMVQSGIYTEIGDPVFFYEELAKSGKSDLTWIIQVAKIYGTDYVCVVSITEVLGTNSIFARLIKITDSQVVKTASTDRLLKSLEDLNAVSNELAGQLLTVEEAPIPTDTALVIPVTDTTLVPPQQDTVTLSPPLAAILAPVVEQKKCARTYNINELLFKIKEGFPNKLQDCSSKLAKDMLTPASFGGKKLEPKSFMVQCPIDGIKNELPEGFPDVDKVLGSLQNFVQTLMNSAISGGGLDPKKLLSAVASMNIVELLNEIKKLSANECVVDEPYEPIPVTPNGGGGGASIAQKSDSDKENNNAVSFGIRVGINLSHIYAKYYTYDPYYRRNIRGKGDYLDVFGMQFGFVLDLAASEVFHIQPGLMYIQKGMGDEKHDVTAHYLELPLLTSFKFSAFRLNAGPYIGLCVSSDVDIFDDVFDIGLSAGFGFDIDMFYMGAFYNYGFTDMSDKHGYNFYNRTLGINLGINL